MNNEQWPKRYFLFYTQNSTQYFPHMHTYNTVNASLFILQKSAVKILLHVLLYTIFAPHTIISYIIFATDRVLRKKFPTQIILHIFSSANESCYQDNFLIRKNYFHLPGSSEFVCSALCI